MRITRWIFDLDEPLDIKNINIDEVLSELDKAFEKCCEQYKKAREERKKNRDMGKEGDKAGGYIW